MKLISKIKLNNNTNKINMIYQRLDQLKELIDKIDRDLNELDPNSMVDCDTTIEEYKECLRDYNTLKDLYHSLLHTYNLFNV